MAVVINFILSRNVTISPINAKCIVIKLAKTFKTISPYNLD